MTRGLRNNNPLNIRHSADHWQGAAEEQTDKAFVQFKTLAYGYRAAWKVLESYFKTFHNERKPYTVRNIIARWAPAQENDTEAYIRSVVNLAGLGGNENMPRPLRYYNYNELEKMVRLIAAMTCVENGISYKKVDTDAIWLGYDLAFPGRRKETRTSIPSGSPVDVSPFYVAGQPVGSSPDWDEYWDWSPEAFGA